MSSGGHTASTLLVCVVVDTETCPAILNLFLQFIDDSYFLL